MKQQLLDMQQKLNSTGNDYQSIGGAAPPPERSSSRERSTKI